MAGLRYVKHVLYCIEMGSFPCVICRLVPLRMWDGGTWAAGNAERQLDMQKGSIKPKRLQGMKSSCQCKIKECERAVGKAKGSKKCNMASGNTQGQTSRFYQILRQLSLQL